MDNNATTMVDPAVKEAMEPFFCEMYGNPNSLHSFGSEVHPFMRQALDRLYAGINASDDDDIIITSCACESNNTVIKSAYLDGLASGKNHFITSQTEHPSVAEAFNFLEKMGANVTRLPVDANGLISPDELKAAINGDSTALVSLIWANNETGIINPVEQYAEICLENNVPLHLDAVQAVGKIPVDMAKVGASFITFSAHKFHGPKGVGGLYMRKGQKLTPLIHGGEQMAGLRAGTINMAFIAGMGIAMELAVKNLDYEATQVRMLRDRLEEAILSIEDTFVIGRNSPRTPNTILASFKGVEGEAMLWDLNKMGVAASTGSACSSESLQANPTFVAMDISEELSHTGIRFSLSRFTTDRDIDIAIHAINAAVQRLRSISYTKEKEYV